MLRGRIFYSSRLETPKAKERYLGTTHHLELWSMTSVPLQTSDFISREDSQHVIAPWAYIHHITRHRLQPKGLRVKGVRENHTKKEPAEVVSLLVYFSKRCCFPPRVDKKIPNLLYQDPMTIRKYLGKKIKLKNAFRLNNTDFYSFLRSRFRVYRLLPSTHAGDRMKKKRQAGVNKYRDRRLRSVRIRMRVKIRTRWNTYTDRQTIQPFDWLQTFIRTYIHDDKTVYEILST
ncbi:hypothetical protein AVEN_245408-1 [Araneus ventricosus]|uniref:Uncharacterized protein n=1 Tax=Araneus ventricosus TaxID=182803 RepID=A0A4Y2LD48_ARAVE|nr:hypothetical protein AVEN_245408-1 [Araneus ventricosus]